MKYASRVKEIVCLFPKTAVFAVYRQIVAFPCVWFLSVVSSASGDARPYKVVKVSRVGKQTRESRTDKRVLILSFFYTGKRGEVNV